MDDGLTEDEVTKARRLTYSARAKPPRPKSAKLLGLAQGTRGRFVRV